MNNKKQPYERLRIEVTEWDQEFQTYLNSPSRWLAESGRSFIWAKEGEQNIVKLSGQSSPKPDSDPEQQV